MSPEHKNFQLALSVQSLMQKRSSGRTSNNKAAKITWPLSLHATFAEIFKLSVVANTLLPVFFRTFFSRFVLHQRCWHRQTLPLRRLSLCVIAVWRAHWKFGCLSLIGRTLCRFVGVWWHFGLIKIVKKNWWKGSETQVMKAKREPADQEPIRLVSHYFSPKYAACIHQWCVVVVGAFFCCYFSLRSTKWKALLCLRQTDAHSRWSTARMNSKYKQVFFYGHSYKCR